MAAGTVSVHAIKVLKTSMSSIPHTYIQDCREQGAGRKHSLQGLVPSPKSQ